jgi:AcrR family transcriptional regulator
MRAAQVSVETVYTNFGSKGALLREALDVVVVGADEPVTETSDQYATWVAATVARLLDLERADR